MKRSEAVALLFEWDDEKAQNNILKHGVSFDEAGSAFEDPLSMPNTDVTVNSTHLPA
ncbi:MAG: BrnT family toxin [Spirochaetales bacterium]